MKKGLLCRKPNKSETKSNKIFLTKKGLELCSLDTSRNAQQYGAEHFR